MRQYDSDSRGRLPTARTEGRRTGSGHGLNGLEGAREVGLDRREGHYSVERRVRDLNTNAVTEEWGVWVMDAPRSEINRTDPPRMAGIDYRVAAINPTGRSMESNVVTVVL